MLPLKRPVLCRGGVLVFDPLEHDPEKWKPVFGKDHAQMKDLNP
jgi:hypothetical protein